MTEIMRGAIFRRGERRCLGESLRLKKYDAEYIYTVCLYIFSRGLGCNPKLVAVSV